MNARANILAPLALCGLLLCGAACTARPGDVDSPATAAEATSDGGEAAETVTGEVPRDLLGAVVDDLAAKTGAERSAIEVVRAEAVTWNDASLGCPEPGKVYIQMLSEGYRIILRHAGEDYDYRATRGGSFVLCERSS